MTWSYGVIHKLCHLGFIGKLLRIFKAMLSGSSSRVVMNGHLSEPFLYCTRDYRQGSIWSPFLYTIYINELLNNLRQSPFGLKINKIPVCAPTQADDVHVVLLSLTKNGLLNICYTYAHKWRYRYNAIKCAVLVQSKNIRQSRDIQLRHGNMQIETVKECTHLDKTRCNNRKTPASVGVVRQKARGALIRHTESECGVHINGLNPITGCKLFTVIVLPRAFFTCELWNTNTVILRITVSVATRGHLFPHIYS